MTTPSQPDPRFTPDLFGFLKELADNNDRLWFNEHKPRYEHAVKEPALDFIEAFRPQLHGISRHFEANARANGGSLFRIHRDTRFGKDKTPYKTNTGLHFRHELAKDAHSPGFYLHLEPRGCFVAAGMWNPEPRVAHQIRAFIDAEPARWRAVTEDPDFAQFFTLAGDRLVRPPRGFDNDHPLIDDLRRKSFMARAPLTQRQVTQRSFIDLFGQRAATAGPLVRFLCDAVGIPF